MRIILSRKGVDSGIKSGGIASPILGDSLVSLPIPSGAQGEITYDDLDFGRHSFGKIVEDLTGRRLRRTRCVHLDPDLRRTARKRMHGWRPIFGQAGASEAHLRNRGVTVGDLFLFFGWFKDVEIRDGKYGFRPSARNLHVIFGWLQIGAVLNLGGRPFSKIPWAADHLHFYGGFGTVYIASDNLRIGGRSYDIPGAGAFRRYDEALRLTDPEGRGRSYWRLPGWLYPRKGRSPLSYHPDVGAFTRKGKETVLRSTARGQEYVLDTHEYPDAIGWARQLIASNASNSDL